MIVSEFNQKRNRLILAFGGKVIRVWTFHKDETLKSVGLLLEMKDIKKLYSILNKIITK